jgi:4-hydroxybenzoate polyprenyltransferase
LVIKSRVSLITIAYLLRVHHWTKNFLLFVPLFAAHVSIWSPKWQTAVIAFLSFNLIASSIYILNDIVDLVFDRAHQTKRSRPLASGTISVVPAILIGISLLLGGLFIGFKISGAFLSYELTYVLLNILYIIKFKKVIMIDVVLLALFYILRIEAGGVATNIGVSHWLLSFSSFLFFGLAIIKRYSELIKAGQLGIVDRGRDYRLQDKEALLSIGTASSLLAIVVLTLYLNSPQSYLLYQHPERLWLTVPILLFWTGRIWLLAHRKRINGDLILFLFFDIPSWIAGSSLLFVLLLSV